MPSVTFLAIMLLLRVGQVLYFAGLVRSKNAASTAMRLLLDLAVVALAVWAIGMGFLPDDMNKIFDPKNLIADSGQIIDLLLGVLPIVLISTGCVAGAILERTRIAPLLVFSAIAALMIPILMQIGHRLGYEASGLSLATLFGGSAAVVAARIASPRKGKYNRDLSVNFIPGHNVTFQILGTLILFAGFTAVSRNGLCMILGTSASVLSSSLFGKLKFGKIDTGLALAGMIGGFCAAGAGIDRGWVAVLAGAVVGIAIPYLLIMIEVQFRIDDVAASTATHLFGGISGTLVTIFMGIYALPEEKIAALLNNLMVAGFAILAGGAVALAVFNLFAKAGKLRVSESAEFDGTDLSELDLNSYPDFQQTMIKSYHLREV